MANSKAKFAIWLGVTTLTVGMLIGCKEKPQNGGQRTEAPASPKGYAEASRGQIAEDNSPSSEPPTLKDIVARRRGWGPVQTMWYGKEAPDFTVTDITGKQHKLSDYRGRNVILNVWATWCRPCHMEIPHLIELLKTIGEDKLAILGISYIGPMNSAEIVKRFVETNPIINYPVISIDEQNMPEPYNRARSIPANFFIDPQGRIKLATEGVMPLADAKAVIEAVR